jgi:hypothetical protein
MSLSNDYCRRVRISPYRAGSGMPVFTLTMWDDAGYDSMGKQKIRYSLTALCRGVKTALFAGSDFSCSPMHASDSDETVAALMGFLTLKPGDTDADYFDGYTEAQHAFAAEHAEAVACEVEYRFSKAVR